MTVGFLDYCNFSQHHSSRVELWLVPIVMRSVAFRSVAWSPRFFFCCCSNRRRQQFYSIPSPVFEFKAGWCGGHWAYSTGVHFVVFGRGKSGVLLVLFVLILGKERLACCSRYGSRYLRGWMGSTQRPPPRWCLWFSLVHKIVFVVFGFESWSASSATTRKDIHSLTVDGGGVLPI